MQKTVLLEVFKTQPFTSRFLLQKLEFLHDSLTNPGCLQVFVARGKGSNVFSLQISRNNFRREIRIHLHYSIHSSNDDFTKLLSFALNLLSVFTHALASACVPSRYHTDKIFCNKRWWFRGKEIINLGQWTRRRNENYLFLLSLFCRFSSRSQDERKRDETIWAIVWSLLLYVSVVNPSAEHFSCRTGEMLPTLNPRKHPQKRFHVKQIFMFIFRLEFMKQYTLFDINDFDCKYIIEVLSQAARLSYARKGWIFSAN